MTNDTTRRILIADDDPEVRRILTTALRNRGLTIDHAEDGRQAEELLLQHSYAVVLLDLVMPHADGFEVLDEIARRDSAPPVVIVVTGAEPQIVSRLDADRIHGVIRKPFDPLEVAAVVAACVEIRSRSA